MLFFALPLVFSAKYQFFDQKAAESTSTTYVTASSSFDTTSSDSKPFDSSIISISSDSSVLNELDSFELVSDPQECTSELEENKNDSSYTEKSASISYVEKSNTSDDLNNTFDEINKLLAQSRVSNSPPSTQTPLKSLNSNPTKVVSKSETKLPVPIFKVPFKSNSSRKLPNLKNIVSPVGVYIRHGPQYCPLTNVPDRKVATKLFPTAIKENIPQQDDFVVPPVLYKPAKKQQVIDVATAKLPESIDRLVCPKTVIKHEGRIEGRPRHYQSTERRLMEPDLSINDTQFDQDVSIVTQKAPFQL